MAYTPQNPTIWAELPVSDLEKGITFYSAVTGTDLDKMDMDGGQVAIFRAADNKSCVSANLYVGTPANDGSGPIIHLAADGKSESVMDRVKAAGGKVVSEIVQLPEGRFFYAQDPDGNRVGLFEVA